MTSITAIIPAHNEEATIQSSVKSVIDQVDHVIVIADNCTDNTVQIAETTNAITFETINNTHKKAGALNQLLPLLLASLQDDDLILVLDADSKLDNDFISYAVEYHNNDPFLGAIGGTFRGDYSAGKLLGHLQRNEYARYARDVRRLKGRCLVVTGTAAVFKVKALRSVSEARCRRSSPIPKGDGKGGIYDTTVLTEDNEITFALMHLNWTVKSPRECTLVTEVMTSWRALAQQRLRWKRGAVENCFQYGITKITWKYWARQIFTMLGIIVTIAYITSLVWAAIWGPGISIHPFWLVVTGGFVLERIITLKDRGLKRQLLAGLMYELIYDIFLQLIHAKAYLDALLHRQRTW